MANYSVTDTDMTTLADAIRAKSGEVGGLVWPAGFVNGVQGLGGGFTITESATVTYDNTSSYSPSEKTQELDQDTLYLLRRVVYKSNTGSLEIWLIYHDSDGWHIQSATSNSTAPATTASIEGDTLTFKNIAITGTGQRAMTYLHSIGRK